MKQRSAIWVWNQLCEGFTEGSSSRFSVLVASQDCCPNLSHASPHETEETVDDRRTAAMFLREFADAIEGTLAP